VERIELPKPGTWVRQGQKAISLFRNGEKIEMVSPVEGEIVEVNQDLLTDPELLAPRSVRQWLADVRLHSG